LDGIKAAGSAAEQWVAQNAGWQAVSFKIQAGKKVRLKRNHLVLILLVAALVLMVWSGVANYRRRKAEQEQLKKMQAVLTPATPTASDSGAAPETEEKSPLEGKPAPAFTLENLQGQKVSLASYKGKAVLVNFMATWCAPCKVETPWLIKLRDQYAPQGFEVLGISTDDLDKDDKKQNAQDKADIAKFVSNMHIDYPVLIDGDSISHPYGGIDALPTSFFVDRSGKVIAAIVGLHDRDELEANIKKALASGGA
jgi:cytochrome c biogenesis protein CcmG/thiol:disulfide interchange protein DsbE